MKTINYLTFALLTICVINIAQAQNNQLLPINCNTNFWTITDAGYIQQWSLSNGTISGGDTILSGGGTSLSYCGNSNAPTFFSNSYTQVGITYYDTGSGWINIPTYNVVDNGGGHLNDQYYLVEGAVIQVVKYWDGVNLMTVDSLNGEFFAGTQDIGVDTLGQAWVFTGPTPGTVDSLKVYNQNGIINAYSIHFSEVAYGSFFLNDTLYLGTLQDSIFPVIISGSTAQLGNPTPFPNNSFTDMASCQETESTTSISEYTNTKIKIYPNPTSESVVIEFEETESSPKSLKIINSLGQIEEIIDITSSDEVYVKTSDIPPGLYFIEVTYKDNSKLLKKLIIN